MQVRKRDGRTVDADGSRIARAVKSAACACGYGETSADALGLSVMESVLDALSGTEIADVEEIQDLVERELMAYAPDVAKSYILYRNERTLVREGKTGIARSLDSLMGSSAADEDALRENGNINGDSPMGAMLKYGSTVAKDWYLKHCISAEYAKAHDDGDIYIHDLDFYGWTTTCCQIDLRRLFENGFSTGHGFIRPPQSIQSYAALTCIVLQADQNDQHGGQSIPAFDYFLAPGVAKTFIKELCWIVRLRSGSEAAEVLRSSLKSMAADMGWHIIGSDAVRDAVAQHCDTVDEVLRLAEERTCEATYQAMESLIHNLNTMHSRAGAQVPFTSINFGTDTSEEGRMVIRQFLLALEAGLGDGSTSIFPISIWKYRTGYSAKPGDPNYDLFLLACRVSAKRLFPNFLNLDAPFNAQYLDGDDPDHEVSTMGCRTRVMGNVYDKEHETTFSRGNLSFTTINLPRLGIKHRGDVRAFFAELKEKVELVFGQLLERLEVQKARYVRNFPFLMGQGVWLGSDELCTDNAVGDILNHGTLSVGIIGLAECLKALIGEHHGESQEAQMLGLRIVGEVRRMCDEKAAETGLNFTLLGTPAEGLSGKFVEKDRRIYGTIPGVTDRDYYTNSNHVPVYFPISMAKKIDIEAPYHAMENAGHITYVELDGSPAGNVDAYRQIVEYMMEKDCGYCSINYRVDRCNVCGYTGIIGDCCPRCGVQEGEVVPFEKVREIRRKYMIRERV